MQTWQDKSSPLYEGLPFMEIEGNVPVFPCVCEPKLDGEFQYLVSRGEKVYLVNKKEHGRIRTDMPVTNLKLPPDSIFTAELIWGKGTNFYDFLRHKLDDNLNLGVFGCLRLEGQDIWKTHTYAESRRILEQQKFYNPKVALVPRFIAHSLPELNDFFNRVVAQEFEGIVIKDLLSRFTDGQTGRWMKKKFEGENDLVIYGFESGTKRAKTLSVLVGHNVNGRIEPLTHVGGGFNNGEKDAMLARLKPLIKGRQGDTMLVEPKVVIKVKHNGIIRDESGVAHSLRHPQYMGIRYDKDIKGVDTIK